MNIVVKKIGKRYYAYHADNPSFAHRGDTAAEAIGYLVQSVWMEIGVKITYAD